MKILYLDVGELNTNQEKDALVEKFHQYGWESSVKYNNKLVGNTRIILGYELTWWLSSEPLIPSIPDNCNLLNVTQETSR